MEKQYYLAFMHRLKYLLFLLLALIAAGGVTYGFIHTHIDWWWAVFFNQHDVWVAAAVPFVLAGMVVPVGIPAFYYWRYKRSKQQCYRDLFQRTLGAFITGYVLMTVLKVFTNRLDMEPFEPIGTENFSGEFRFGFMNSNSWWESFSEGWPSGHTLIALAMAITVWPHVAKKWGRLHLLYAILVALSVSTAFHWISDVISGALLGVVVGLYFGGSQGTKK